MRRFFDLTIVGILEGLIFMSLGELRKTWDTMAVSDPWRAILGRPGEGKQWDAEEFFQSGEYEVAATWSTHSNRATIRTGRAAGGSTGTAGTIRTGTTSDSS